MYADARKHRVPEVRIHRGLRTATYVSAAMPLALLSYDNPSFRSESAPEPKPPPSGTFLATSHRARFDDCPRVMSYTYRLRRWHTVAGARAGRVGPAPSGRNPVEETPVGETPVDMNNVEQGT